MLPKAYLTSHSRMSDSRWRITPSWLSKSLRQCIVLLCILPSLLNLLHFCYIFSFLSFIVPIFAWNVPLVIPNILKRSLVFLTPILFFSSISLHCSLRKAFSSLLLILQNSALNGYIFPFHFCLLLLFFSQLFARPPQTTTLPSCISFSWGWFCSTPPVQCYEPSSIVLQELCLSDLIPHIYYSPPLYNHKGCDSGHTWMV